MTSDFVYFFIIMMTTLLLYEKSSAFKYYLKFLVYSVGTVFSATIFIPLMFFKPCDYRNALLPAWGSRQLARFLGIKLEIRGQKNIVQDEGCVVLINHQSIVDLFVLAEIWPVMEKCTVISKKSVFYYWPFGLAAWLWGTVFIDRSSKKDAQDGVNKAASAITSKKAKICFFPEGTRHGGEKLLPFKKGAFHIAIDSHAPIQPIVVRRYTFLDYKTCRFDEGSSIISILPSISTKDLNKDDINALLEKTYKIMSDEYVKLNTNT